MAACSTSGLSSATRARRITVTYEIENVVWAIISVVSDGCSPTPLNSISDATPVTISGVISGISMMTLAAAPSRDRARTRPKASSTPMTTEPTIATAATRRLVSSDSVSSASLKRASYHCSDQPSKTVSDFFSLNENSTTATIGR